MKIYPEQLAAQLQKNLAPIYIVSGDDLLLTNEACTMIRTSATKQDFTEREILTVDKGFNWQNLLTTTETQSLFATKKLIELCLPSGKPGTKGSEILKQYADNISPDNLLLIITNKLETTTQNSAWFKKLNKTAIFIPVWPPTATQLPKWLHQRLTNAGLTANSDAIQLLADFSEGNLLAATQEIEKLRLLYGQGNITTQQIVAAITDSAHFTIFDLVDTIFSGNSAKGVRILHALKQEKTEPTVILWAITRELRSLNKMLRQKKQGIPVEQVLQKNRVWEKRKSIVRHALQKNSTANLLTSLQKCAQIDQIIKGVTLGNSWNELEKIIMEQL